MNNYIKKFAIPFLQLKIVDWASRKDSLMKIYREVEKDMALCDQYTDYKDSSNPYIKDIERIFLNEINAVRNSFELNECILSVDTAWFQKYFKGHHHEIHNHGYGGVSAVCFIEFDSKEHQPTKFIAPFNNFFTCDMLDFTPEGVEEGTIIFFPAGLSHYVAPSRSDKTRIILSFNMKILK